MSDSKISSSNAPPSLSGAGASAKPAGITGAVQGASAGNAVQDALVSQSPPNILSSGQGTEMRGTVLSSNPARGQIDIATPKGEFVVQSTQDIQAGTDVSLRLSMRQNQLLATITIIKHAQTPALPEPELPTPAPAPAQAPLKAGDRVPAVRMAQTPPAPPASSVAPAPPQAQTPPPLNVQAPLTLQDIVQILQSLPLASLAQLPGPPPVPQAVLYALMQAQDIMTAIAQLPAAQQQALAAYIAREDVQSALRQLAGRGPAPPQPAQPSPAAAPSEQDAATLLRAHMGAFMQGLPAQSAASPSVLPRGGFSSLLPLLQALETPQALPTSAALNALQHDMPPAGTGALTQNLVSLTLLSVTSPAGTGTGTGAPPPQAPLAQNVFSGTVVSLTSDGFPIVQTQDGQDFVLRTQAPVAVGSTLVFRASKLPLQEALAHFGMQAESAQDAVFNALRDTRWPALQDALRTLASVSPQATQQLAATLPAPAARFAPATLLFLAALRLDSVQSWLGDSVLQTLKQSAKASSADRLSADFSKIAEQARTALPSGWRAVSLPLMHESELSQAQLFWRRQDDAAEEGAASARKTQTTRFLLNVRLSRLGDMQLDGLMRQKRLDMIVRGEKMLPPSVRRDITAAYAQAMAQTGMEGSVGFQVRADQWVSISLPRADAFSA